jgi:DNA polymerase bacteriophage-type
MAKASRIVVTRPKITWLTTLILFGDTETAGVLDLTKVGVYRYVEAGARPTLFASQWCHHASDFGELQVQDWYPEFAKQLSYMMSCAERVVFHNAEFDVTVLEAAGVVVPREKIYCTMAQARRHGLPGGLDKLSQIFKIPLELAKIKEGRRLMYLFCKPNKDGWWNTRETHPKEWAEFKVYAGHDVLAAREVYFRCPKWNDDLEAPVYELDQVINRRGFQVDTTFAWWAVQALADSKDALNDSVRDATGGDVERGTQRDKLLAYIMREYGVQLPDLTQATLERRLKDEALPDMLRDLIALRLQSAKVSTSKYATLLKCVNADGRLRGVKVYCGASRTGRWAATKFQSDNQPRQILPEKEIDLAIRAIKSRSLHLVGDHSLSRYASESIRGVVVARPGCKLLVADLANIEGRTTARLAHEEWKLQAFAAYDRGVGHDLYRLAYGEMFGVDPATVEGLNRQIGKVVELFLQYGGSVGAFITGADTYKIDLAVLPSTAWPNIPRGLQIDAQRAWFRAWLDDLTLGLEESVYCTCWALSRLWRLKNPKIVELWDDLERAAKWTTVDGATRQVGILEFSKVGNWLRMKLPSGRYLNYPSPRIEKSTLHFWGVDPYKKQWRWLETRGSKLLENAAQGWSRDILADGMLEAERRELWPVLHVHDEPICEVTPDRRPEELVECLVQVEAHGTPLAAKGFECQRYYKAA